MNRGERTAHIALPAWTLTRREIVRFLRQRSRVVGAVGTPLVFWLLFGGGIGQSIQAPGAGDHYLEFSYPGAITAILVAAVSVAVHQARPATTGGKWLIAAATPEPAPRVDASNRQQVSVFELQPGTCLSDIDVPADVQMVPVVPCYTEHQAEVIATLRMPGGPWPGRAVVDEFAVAECVPAVLRVRTEVRDDLQWTYFGPTENSWTVRADRTVSCLIVSRGAPLDGPVVTGRAAL